MWMIRMEDVLNIVSKYCPDDDGSCSKAGVDLREMLDEIEGMPETEVQPVKHGRFEALDVVSNEKYVELKDGLKKFRSGNFVVYDINYLLKNLAREITLLYQTSKDFSKSALNIDNIRRMFVDYAPCEKCTNPDTYGEICVKCGACGRKFDDKGVLIDNE